MKLFFNSNCAKITFLNHASFVIESRETVLVIDPWLEGFAFNNGWALLDQSTNNEVLISALLETKKKIFFWYSHEHSDHFATPLLKRVNEVGLDIVVLFQNTLDQRVTSYLKRNNITAQILRDGEEFELDQKFIFSLCAWRSGDSLSFLSVEGVSILNINDCIVSKKEDAQKIKKILGGSSMHVDYLFSQFGYANWEGNEEDKELRKSSADEKLRRLAIQEQVFEPRFIIPFASFVFFSHEDNFYINDEQNTPQKLRSSEHLKSIQDQIIFLKPYDQLELTDADDTVSINKELSKNAENHWNFLFNKIEVFPVTEKKVSIEEIKSDWLRFRSRVFFKFLGLFQILEIFRIIKPLTFKLDDLNIFVRLSYLSGLDCYDGDSDWDLAIKSSVLGFSVKYEFGFDTTLVNGRFRISKEGRNIKAMKFFGAQGLIKNGFGWNKPIATFFELFRLAKRED